MKIDGHQTLKIYGLFAENIRSDNEKYMVRQSIRSYLLLIINLDIFQTMNLKKLRFLSFEIFSRTGEKVDYMIKYTVPKSKIYGPGSFILIGDMPPMIRNLLTEKESYP